MAESTPSPATLNKQGLQAIIENVSRLEALNATRLLGTPAEEVFDRITALAARLLSVPVTFIALVDDKYDFYKSAFGFGSPLAEERNLKGRTFCHYTIAAGAPLVIPDTLADPVYSQVLTVKSLGIRAYLGIPLKAVGEQVIGSLCAIDFQPRQWRNDDIEVLSELALSTAREIDLRIITSEALRNANVARESMRAKEEILAVVAHDLRSPLNVLSLGAAHLAKTHGTELGPLLDLMGRANAQMTAMVSDLLEVNAFSSDNFALDKSSFRPDVLIADAIKLASPIAAQKNIKFVKQGATVIASVSIDYARILRVFANLIGNAIKFSPAGSEVYVSAEDAEGNVRFVVRDFGEGIAADKTQQIFERYWQGNQADARGVGLGLGIAKAIVEKHHGSIGVESTLGEGSSFWFILPKSAKH
jgi:signal transduction histidine kinase